MRALLITTFLCFLLLPGTAPWVQAQPFADRSAGGKTGLVVLSSMTTPPYGVVKLAFATVGTLLGGAINLFSLGHAGDTASRIALGAADGDWYVHPDLFTGERSLRFIGPGATIQGVKLPLIIREKQP
ncbi:MAG: hypothetical protein D6736_13865 [Nitrospinota bacterium]|nr:MAG: hypothetical protein D6736_13865 [Nitrospinota bacterium]